MYNFFYKKEEEKNDGGYLNQYTIALTAIVAILFLIGAILMVVHAKTAVQKITQNRLIKLRLIVIEADSCKECFDINKVISFVKDTHNVEYVKTKKYKASDKNAKLLIKTHKINNLPTFILQGNLERLKLDTFFESSSVNSSNKKEFVYKNIFPPYYNLGEKKIRGQFSLLYLTDKSCKKCYDIKLHNAALKNLVMKPVSSSTIETSSKEGRAAIKKYKIKYAPTILLRGDLDTYQNFKNLWTTVGTVEKDGTYIFREDGLKLMGVYKNINTWKLMNTK